MSTSRCATPASNGAGIGVLLTAMAPVTVVLVITFRFTPRVRRRELWGSFGLRRSDRSAWPMACLVPILLAGGAYGVAVALDVADLRSFDIGGVAFAVVNLVTQPAPMRPPTGGHPSRWSGEGLDRVAARFARSCSA